MPVQPRFGAARNPRWRKVISEYRGIWRCKGVYGDVLGYMVLYMGIWCCIGIYGDVTGCMVMYRAIWCCIGVYGDVKGCMVMYGDV